jgi:hypothetical protein
MSRLLLALALALPLGAVAAPLHTCDYESEFDLHVAPDALSFEREAGTPARLRLRDGRLEADGRAIALSADDAARLRRYEREVRALVPVARRIAVDAVGIATAAIGQVASAFAGADAATPLLEKTHALGERLVQRIELADDTRDLDQGEFEREIARLTAEVVPLLVSEAASAAVAAALSGDTGTAQSLERRVQQMEKDLERTIERRADGLKRRVDELCPRLAALDEIEAALALRLEGGARFDVLQPR